MSKKKKSAGSQLTLGLDLKNQWQEELGTKPKPPPPPEINAELKALLASATVEVFDSKSTMIWKGSISDVPALPEVWA